MFSHFDDCYALNCGVQSRSQYTQIKFYSFIISAYAYMFFRIQKVKVFKAPKTSFSETRSFLYVENTYYPRHLFLQTHDGPIDRHQIPVSKAQRFQDVENTAFRNATFSGRRKDVLFPVTYFFPKRVMDLDRSTLRT